MGNVRAFIFILSMLAVGFVKSGYAAGPDDASVTPDSDRALGPGDSVSFEIVEDKVVPVKKIISDTGSLDVPYIGAVKVSGKSCDEAAAQIKKLLEAKYYFTATVKIAIEQIAVPKPHPPNKVLVSGKVTTVGVVEIPFGQKLTASGAIVKAGGATQFGELRKVKLTRKNTDGSSKTFILDIKAVIEGGKADQDMDLQDGDSIFVPPKLFNF